MTKIAILVLVLALVMAGILNFLWLPVVAFIIYMPAIVMWVTTGYFVGRHTLRRK